MIQSIGKYCLFLGTIFSNRISIKVCIQQTLKECVNIGINSLFIVATIALFIGAVTTLQTAAQFNFPLVPKNLIGLSVRSMIIFELAPTVIGIVFAGKIGSNIASELGSMRISEQIAALEIMGINAVNYLVLPKIIATVLMYPLLVIAAIAISLYGGFLACAFIPSIGLTPDTYIEGIRLDFHSWPVYAALAKALTFGFLIASIACYKGFHTFGGAFEVGKSCTSAVTTSCIAILIADWFLAKLLF